MLNNQKVYVIAIQDGNKKSFHSGTLKQLNMKFSYALQCGHTNSTFIAEEPKTFTTFFASLSKAFRLMYNAEVSLVGA